MFELGIFCVILLAVSYWATAWTMGRRGDVLHGNFIEREPQVEAAAPATTPGADVESIQALLAAIKRDRKQATQSR